MLVQNFLSKVCEENFSKTYWLLSDGIDLLHALYWTSALYHVVGVRLISILRPILYVNFRCQEFCQQLKYIYQIDIYFKFWNLYTIYESSDTEGIIIVRGRCHINSNFLLHIISQHIYHTQIRYNINSNILFQWRVEKKRANN